MSGIKAVSAVERAVEAAVIALHYQLVDVERTTGGLLRVTIDREPGLSYPSGPGEFITVDDCEAVTRQLKYALEVASVDYHRLEVSSPGLDRPLKRAADYQRFAGQEVNITLREPFQGRKNYKGVLVGRDGGWRLEMEPTATKAGPKGKAKAAARTATVPPAQALADGGLALDFTLDEVREARLVPVIDFKGRAASQAEPEAALAAQDMDGGHPR
jgi:ribosome maturation factor RimP